MIAIQSNKKLMFPPASVGFIKMEIDLIQNKPSEGIYEIRIVDSCIYTITETIPSLELDGASGENQVETTKVLASTIRFKTYTYEWLNQLGNLLQIHITDFSSSTDYINELFRKGLLLITQQECQQGISMPGKGMYFSEAQDWEIINI